MNRRNFIKKSCISCITGLAINEVLQGCTATKYSAGTIKDDYLLLPLSTFENAKDNAQQRRKYVVIQNDLLKFPICVYLINDTTYEALWMECTHQGAELQVFGDKLQCPAHGSEFSNRGTMHKGPADNGRRNFPITIEKDKLIISVKAV